MGTKMGRSHSRILDIRKREMGSSVMSVNGNCKYINLLLDTILLELNLFDEKKTDNINDIARCRMRG